MTSKVDSAIGDFYTKAIEMQKASAEQMKALAKALQENNSTLAHEKKEQFDVMLQVANQISDVYAQTAAKLMELESLNNQGKIAELNGLIDLNFFIKKNQFDLLKKEMEELRTENSSLREQNGDLRTQNENLVTKFAEIIIQKTIDPWRISKPGLNLEGLCINSNCQAGNKRVIMSVGQGQFDIGSLVFRATCPLCNKAIEDVDRLIIQKCVYTIDVGTQDRQIIKKANENVSDIANIDISNWMKGTIIVRLS